MGVLIVLGGAGGILAALTAVVVIGRGVFRQATATEDNTEALRDLTAKVGKLTDTVTGHETRITVLEDRTRRGPPGPPRQVRR